MLTRDEEDDGEGLDHNDDVYHRYNNNNNGWEGTNDGQREDIGNDHARESKGRRRNMIVDDNDYEHNQDGSTTTTTAATAHPSSSSSSLSSIPLPPPAPAQTLDTEVQARIAANKARALAKLAEKRKFMTARLEHIDQQNNGVDGGEAGKMTSQTQQQQQQQQSSSSSTMEEDLDEEERIMMEMERSGNPTPQEEDDDSPLF